MKLPDEMLLTKELQNIMEPQVMAKLVS